MKNEKLPKIEYERGIAISLWLLVLYFYLPIIAAFAVLTALLVKL